MTLSAKSPVTEYLEDGVSVTFPVPWRYRAPSHLRARRISSDGTVSELVHGVDFSAVDGDSDAGGSLTLFEAGASGGRLKIYRRSPRVQDADYIETGAFTAESHETSLDELAMIDQEQDREIDDTKARALLVPDGEEIADLPAKADRIGRFLAGDANGNLVPSQGTGADLGLREDIAGALGSGLMGYRGRSVLDALDQQAADLSAVATGGDLYTGVSALAVVAADSTANVADPSAADVGAGGDASPAIGTTTDNQRHRLRNNGTGTLSAQSSSSLGTFAVTRKIDVVAGEEYTFSLHNCPLGWYIYSATLGRIQYFNTDGSFHSESASFTQDALIAREVTFTVPTGAEKVAFDLRNVTDFSNDNPIDSDTMQVVQDNLMLNLGDSALTFAPYTADAYTPAASRFTGEEDGPIALTIQNQFLFIKTACQLSSTKDVIWRLLYGHGLNYNRTLSRSGVADFYGARFVAKGETVLPSAFNQSTEVHCAGGDESCPERRNGMFVDGGHGSTCYRLTAASHGKANVDVGSIWSDGTDEWLLLYIEDSDTLIFQRRYTGTDTKWSISSAAPGSSTFTHVSGATNTGNVTSTAEALAQFVPIIDDYTSRLVMDGTAISADGDYSGDTFWIDELYIGLNLAKVQDALIADVGNASPDWTPDVEQTRVYNRHEMSRYGVWTTYTARYVTDAYDRAALTDYWGGIQLQRLSLTGDSTPGMHNKAKLYIPDVGVVSGFDFQAIADYTSNGSQVDILASDCDDPADPASLFCLIGTDAADAILSGQVFGYDPAVGLGVPATRAANADRVLYFSSSEKNYPVLIDAAAGDAAAGDTFEAACWRAPFLPTDPELTIPGVILQSYGRTYCAIAAHQALDEKEVAVPEQLTGRTVTIVRGEGLTLDNGFVREGKIQVSVPGAHGWALLELG